MDGTSQFIFDMQRFNDYPITGTFGENNDWSYTLTDDGTLTITGTGDMPNPRFDDDIKASIKTVVIGENVTSIGKEAFYQCNKLEGITLPASLTTIGENAFDGCSALTSVDLSKCTGLTTISKDAFSSCSALTSIKLPSSVTSIDRAAFFRCRGLTSLDLSNCTNLTIIGDSAFYECNKLESIKLPASLTTIDTYAFQGCDKLTSLDLSKCTNLTSIGEYAFATCSGLTSIMLPASLTTIGERAFAYSSGLESIDLSNCTSLKTLGERAFYECDNLTTIKVSLSLHNTLTAEDSTFEYQDKLAITGTFGENNDWSYTLKQYGTLTITGTGDMPNPRFDDDIKASIKTVVIGENVTSIGDSAFAECEGLTNLDLSKCTNLTSIGARAFYDCYENLTSVDLSNCTSLETIGDSAFAECYHLTSVNLSNCTDLTTIGASAFRRCSGLTSVDLSNCTNLTSIGADAFAVCTSLTSLDLSKCTSLTSIGAEAFQSCEKLESVKLPTYLTSIGEYAFSICSGLTSLDLSKCTNLTSIGERAFYYCSKLESITLPTSLTSIGEYAFSDCSKLESITLPASLTSIGRYAFSDCSKLESITLPASLTTLGERAFYECDNLTSVDLSKCTKLTTLVGYAFDSCKALTSVDLSNCTSLTSIGERAFDGCSGLTSLDLSNCTSLKTLVTYTFKDCGGLTSVKLPTGLTSIEIYAFNGCNSLTEVNIGAEDKAVVIGGHKVLGTGIINIKDEVDNGKVNLSYIDCVDTNYLGADGKTTTVSAIPIISGVDYLAAGTYVIKDTLELNNVTLNGEVNLILADGASLTTGTISGGTLNVFSQGGETLGKLTATEISSTFNYNGGNVTATTISGATTLNWTNANDSINATYTGTATIVDGKRFYDNEGNIIATNASNVQLNALDSYIIELPTGAAITGATRINTTNKYVCKSDAAVTISGFNSGEISFDPLITSLTKSGDKIVVKAGDDTAVTISGLTFPVGSNSWKVEDTSSNYGTRCTEGALISGSKIVWGTPPDDIFVTVTGLKSGVTPNETNITLSLDNKKLTINDEALLTDGAVISADNDYTVELASALAPTNPVSIGWDGNDYYSINGYKTPGWFLTDGIVERVEALTPEVTVTGLKSGVTLNATNITVANKKLTINDAALLTDGATISATNNYTVELATNLAPSDAVSKGWDGTSYYSAAGYKTAGWTISNGKVTQVNASTPAVTVTGLKDGVALNDSNITVGANKLTINDAALLTDGATISATNNYTVELASTLAPSNAVSKGWDGTSYYSTAGYKTAGWTLSNGKVTQIAATNPAVTVTGLKSGVALSDSNITVGTNKLTINDASLLTDGATISATNNYTVELASTLAPTNAVNKGWDGTSYYTATGYKTAGWTLANGKVNQVAATNPAVTITGLKSGVVLNDSNITVGTNKLTINDAALLTDGATLSATNNYTVELASTLAPSNAVNKGWDGSSYYSSAGYKTAGWTLANGKVNQVAATNPAVTITGLKSGVVLNDSNITVGTNKLTINDAALLTDGATLSATNNYTVELASTLAPSNAVNKGWDGTSYYTATGYKTTGWTLANGKVNQVAATNPAVTITGLKSGVVLNDSNITVGTNKLTINDAALLTDGATLSATNNYTVELASTLAPSNAVNKGWDGTSYYTATGYKTAGWTLANGKVNQVAATNPAVTITGLKSGVTLSDTNITVGDKKVTINDASLLTNGATLSATNNYTVELASTLAPSNAVNKGWDGSSYYSAAGYKTAGWTLSNGKVNQVAATNPAVTITGLKSGVVLNDSNITVGTNKLTINDASLLTNGATLSATNNYTVELASTLAPSNAVNKGWDGSSYYSAAGYKTAGWTLTNGRVTQIAATNPAVTITGLKSGVVLNDSNITVGTNKLTINDEALLTDGATISATNNYTVELATALAPSNVVNRGWNGTSYYSSAGYKTAGWTLTNGRVTQIAATNPAVTINGLKDGVALNDSNITVGENKLTINDATLLTDGATISATNNYTVELASALEPKTTAASWSEISSGKATYTYATNTAGYTLTNGKVSYIAEVPAKSFTINGIKSTDGIKVDGTTITLSENAIPTDGTAISIETSGYTLATDGLSEVILSNNGEADKANYYYAANGTLPVGYIKSTGSDEKTYYIQEGAKFNKAYTEYGISFRVVEGKTTTYMATAPSGYTKVIDANGTFYTNAITMSEKLTDATVSGKDLVLTAGEEKLTVEGAAKKTVEVTANGVLYKATSSLITNTANNAVTMTTGYDASKGYTATKNTKSINAQNVAENITLNGSKAKLITIAGGSGNDSIVGSKGDDKLAGKAGNDSINSGKGNDKIWGGLGDDYLNGGDGDDKLAGKAGNDSLYGGKGNDKLWGGLDDDYLNGGDGKDKLAGKAGNDSLYGGKGNDKLWGGLDDDYLSGDAGKDSLWGGSGNDSLYGGDGNDVFIYKANEGNDKIFDYTAGDMLKILKADGKEGGSFKKSAFSGGELKLTINGGGTVVFEGVAKGDQFNINGKTYTLSGTKLK